MTNKSDVLLQIREALQAANDDENGPITDTIWMCGVRNETLFDFIDAALATERAAIQPAGDAVRDAGGIVPGKMHCAKCDFSVIRTVLNVATGSAYAGDNKTEPCPNGCGPLWPLTWEQEAREGYKLCDQLFERAKAAEDALMSTHAPVASAPDPDDDVTLPGVFTNADDLFKAMGVDTAPAQPMSLEAERVDAARYRWLRDKSEPGICAFYLSVGKAFHGVKFTQETVDESIDAARALATQQGDKHE